jgi:uncharacterized protein (TIGR03118 family)
MRRLHKPLLLSAALIAGLLGASVSLADDDDDSAYSQTNLVSDIAGQARVQDPNLRNPWGIVFFPGAPFWISDNHTGVSTLYDGQGNIIKVPNGQNQLVPFVVQIPGPSGSPAGFTASPTGIVWNPTQGFAVGPNAPALFIWATEDGTISGWNRLVDATHAILKVDNPNGANGPVYKGLALASNAKGVFLFATNFHDAKVDVFDTNFKPAQLDGSFADPGIPPGYAPFGISLIDGDLFVTYALQNGEKHDDVAGAGHGFVDVFDTDGHLLRRFASRGALNSPWGVTRASYGFGRFSANILIGNFGDGHISGFGSGGHFHGQLRNAQGHPIAIDGLWGLKFGGALASSPDTLYFTAGINAENDGLFGTIAAVTIKDGESDDH